MGRQEQAVLKSLVGSGEWSDYLNVRVAPTPKKPVTRKK